MSESEPLIRPMEPTDADLEAFGDCFARNDMPRRLDALRWQYVQNPNGPLLVDLAVADDRVGAIYAVQPASARVRGEVVLGAQSVDTLVDASLRGRGMFTKMADSLYRRVQDHGGAFVYGFPNGSSAPGFFKKLGWISLDPVPFLIRPLRTAFLASKLPVARGGRWIPDVSLPSLGPTLSDGQALREVDTLGPELDDLWSRFATGVTVAVNRTAEYLRWRLGKPGERYACLGVYEEDRLVAFTAFTTLDKHGGRISYVLELLHEPGRQQVAAALLREALGRMSAAGSEAVLAWAFPHSPNIRAYQRTGFLPLPERLRPIELHVGVRPLDDSMSTVLGNRHSWYLSYCDSDTV